MNLRENIRRTIRRRGFDDRIDLRKSFGDEADVFDARDGFEENMDFAWKQVRHKYCHGVCGLSEGIRASPQILQKSSWHTEHCFGLLRIFC